MKWLRLYHEILDDPKIQRLEPELFKFWVNFLCLANRSDVRGTVQLDPGEIAFALRISDDEALAALEKLQRNGLIELVETGMKPHNWDARQRKSDDVTARVTEFRKRGNVAPAPTETLDETLHATLTATENPSRATEQETDTEPEGLRPPEGPPQPPEEPPAAKDAPKRTPEKRRTRIAVEFTANAALISWAKTDLGLDDEWIRAETEKFRDYWSAEGKPKSDWAAAWRFWMRRSLEYRPGRASPGHRSPPPLRGRPDIGLTNEQLDAMIAEGSP